jgi:hypothetical protein
MKCPDYAKRMAVEPNESAQKRTNASGIALWHQVVTLDDDGDAKSEPT